MSWVPNTAMSSPATDWTSVALGNIVFDEGSRKRPLSRDNIDALKASILKHGHVQPIGVRATTGLRGAPFQLVFGAHRFAAKMELLMEGSLNDSTIPAIIYGSDVSDDTIEIMEIVENLARKELSQDERRDQTARLVELAAKSSGKKVGRKQGAPKGNNRNAGGSNQHARRSNTQPADLTSPPAAPADREQTAIEVAAEMLGVTTETITRRLKRLAEIAGEKIEIHELTPEDIRRLLERAAEREAAEKARKAEAQKAKSQATRAAKKAVQAAEKAANEAETGDKAPAEDKDGRLDVMATDESVEAFAALTKALDLASETVGDAFVHEVVRKWWLRKHPKGEVRFAPIAFGKRFDDAA